MADSSFSTKELTRFYRRSPEATDRAIRAFLRDTREPQMIVHGTRAVNAYLPDWLDRETRDWDILAADKAGEMAHALEDKLDSRYGGDFFSVEAAVHPGTFRIRSKVTGEAVADITLQDKQVSFRKLRGIQYADLDYIEAKSEAVLTDPQAAFRHRKEQDTLQRIAVYRIAQKKKKRAKKREPRWDSPMPYLSEVKW